MAVRWSLSALGLCWLGPFAHDPARQHGLPGREIDPASPASRLASLITPDGGALPANTGENSSLPSASRDSHNEPGRAAPGYCAVLRQLLGPRFLFRNPDRLTPYDNVLFGGVHAAGGAAPTPAAAAANKRH